jgi:hypothetical protein
VVPTVVVAQVTSDPEDLGKPDSTLPLIVV